MNYNKQYHLENAETINSRHKDYYEKHKSEISQKRKAWYVENALRLKIKRIKAEVTK